MAVVVDICNLGGGVAVVVVASDLGEGVAVVVGILCDAR
jgi:hypothetical protein